MLPKLLFQFMQSNKFAKINSLTFAILSVCFFTQISYSQNTPLELNKPIESEIARNEKHVYQIILATNQFAAVTIEQLGIDVAVVVVGTDDEPFVRRDSILSGDGREKIDFTALSAGIYLLELKTKPNFPAEKGRYRITLTDLRDANEKELRLEEARKYHNDSINFYNAGKYDEALNLAVRSLEIQEKESGADDIDVAASLANLALIWLSKGDPKKAIQLFQRSLEIREKVFGTYHHDVARTLHNLALANDNLGNYDEAIRLYEKAILIREKVLGTENADLSTSLGNLGSIYTDLADYDKAEQLLRRALEIKEKILAPTSASIAVTLNNLGSVFSAKGDEDKALELYKRALEIREKALRPNHPDIARSLEFLGTSYRTKGDFKQSEENYLRGLEILRKTFGEEHYRIARMLGNLAVLYQMQGNYDRAELLFRQAVEMMEKTVGKEHSDYATTIYFLARFYTDKGDYEQAEPLYKKALEVVEKLFVAPHPDVISYLNSLARNYQAKGETKQSLDLLKRSHRLSERAAQTILFTSSEKQKLLYLNSLAGETNQYLSAHLKFAPNDAAALELALTTIFERKGRVSDAVAFEFSALRNRFNSNDQILLENLIKINSQLAQKILNATENMNEKQIKELEEQKEKLEQEISRRSSEFRSRIQPATISSIQAAIPENAALIEFAIYRPFDPKAVGNDEKKAFGEPHYVAYVVRRQGAIQWKDLGAAKTIDESTENFRQALRDVKRKDVAQLARIVDKKILAQLRPFLGDATHLLISPDGELNLIPFEALVDEKNQFLIENYSFTYLTSGRDLLRMQTKRESKNNPMVIANPLFGTSETASVSGKRQNDTFFAPLGGTLQEAKSIQTIFPNANILTDANATETVLKQTNAPQILHLATHGFFLEDKKIVNPLLRSGLAFAGANSRKGEKDDGILTALEASGLNLWGTKLVILSACDTGLGEVRNGEGVYGLRRAFVLAGTESLVMSLWSVSDFVTREMMTNYYKNLKNGLGRGASLRQVQLEMLKKPNRQHPFYWASFIQSGDWGNLK